MSCRSSRGAPRCPPRSLRPLPRVRSRCRRVNDRHSRSLLHPTCTDRSRSAAFATEGRPRGGHRRARRCRRRCRRPRPRHGLPGLGAADRQPCGGDRCERRDARPAPPPAPHDAPEPASPAARYVGRAGVTPVRPDSRLSASIVEGKARLRDAAPIDVRDATCLARALKPPSERRGREWVRSICGA